MVSIEIRYGGSNDRKEEARSRMSGKESEMRRRDRVHTRKARHICIELGSEEEWTSESSEVEQRDRMV